MTKDLNVCVAKGRMGKKPELKKTINDVPVVDFSIANNRDYMNKDGEAVSRVNWIQCRAYKRHAENICKYCDKGSKITVEGEITTDSWEDKDTGELKSRTYILVTAPPDFSDNFSNSTEGKEDKEKEESKEEPKETLFESYAMVEDEDIF